MSDSQQLRKEELELLEKVLAGNPSAFSEFYRRYQRLVASCIRKVFFRWSVDFTEEEINDMISTVFLGFLQDDFRKLRLFDPQKGYRLSTWVGIITTNATVDFLRRNSGSPMACLDSEKPVPDPKSHTAGPSEQLVLKEEADLLLLAIGQLSPSDREFVELCYDQQLSSEEIGQRLNLNINTVYSKKNKILHKLKDLVAEISSGRFPR